MSFRAGLAGEVDELVQAQFGRHLSDRFDGIWNQDRVNEVDDAIVANRVNFETSHAVYNELVVNVTGQVHLLPFQGPHVCWTQNGGRAYAAVDNMEEKQFCNFNNSNIILLFI